MHRRASFTHDNGVTLNEAELYDPTTGAWTLTGSLDDGRFAHTATLLLNGKILVSAGFFGGTALSSAELYDPASGTWTRTGSLASLFSKQRSVDCIGEVPRSRGRGTGLG